jgi:hypothetical protein
MKIWLMSSFKGVLQAALEENLKKANNKKRR